MPHYPLITPEDREPLQKFLSEEFKQLYQRRPAGPIFHYTTGAAALSILENATLRATNILYMNDREELHHAVDLVRATTVSLNTSNPRPETMPARNELLRALDEVGAQYPVDVWVVSFTEQRDSTAHWTSYGAGTHAVSLGFDASALAKFGSLRKTYLLPCCYDDAQKLEILRKLLLKMDDLYLAKRQRLQRELTEDERRQLIRFVISEAVIMTAAMKRSEWHHENEWRLITWKTVVTIEDFTKYQFVAKSDYTSIFIEHSFEKETAAILPLTEVTIGPGPHQKLTEMSFRMLLRKLRYPAAVDAMRSQSSRR